MTQDQFHNWFKEPATLNAASISQLQEIIKRYPYFQAAQILLAKNLKDQNHIDQRKQLQLAAVMVPDRKWLYAYLHDIKKKPQPEPQQPTQVKEEPTHAATEKRQAESTEAIAQAPTAPPTALPQPDTAKEEVVEEVERNSLYDLIPEPVVYQLETADLPELPPRSTALEETEEKNNASEPPARSFSQWLAFTEEEETTTLPQQAAEKDEPKRTKATPAPSSFELIDHFLSQQKSKPKKRAEFFTAQKAGAKSLEQDFSVVTETLAKIYVQQQKYELAIQAYQALSLKYPEKSTYFAARLKEIDEKLNSE